MPPKTAETPSAESSSSGGFRVLPVTPIGWWAVGLTALIFPVAYVLMTHAIPWAILDTAFAPVLITLLIDTAAAAGLFAAIKNRDRSLLVIVAALIALPLALLATLAMLAHAVFPEG